MEALFFENAFNYTHLYKLLKIEEFNCSLAYMIDRNKYTKLNVILKEHSIEVSNDDITIAIILFVGFENEEYEVLKNKPNLHIITFSEVVPEMVEFKDLNVKYFNQMSLLYTNLSISENEQNRRMRILRSLK
jgi:hypothetical protein